MKPILKLANKLTKFDHADWGFQKSWHVFPGDNRCNKQESHCKTHEMVANAVVDVALLSDSIFEVIDKSSTRSRVLLEDGAEVNEEQWVVFEVCIGLLSSESELNVIIKSLLDCMVT